MMDTDFPPAPSAAELLSQARALAAAYCQARRTLSKVCALAVFLGADEIDVEAALLAGALDAEREGVAS